MKEIILIIVSWIPVPVISLLLAAAAKYIGKKIKDNVKLPEKNLDELKALKAEMKKLNSYNAKLVEENENLQSQLSNLAMQLKGHLNYGEDVKKN